MLLVLISQYAYNAVFFFLIESYNTLS